MNLVQTDHSHSSTAIYGLIPNGNKQCVDYSLQIPLPNTITTGPIMRDQFFSYYCSDYFPRIVRTGDIDLSHFVISGIFALSQKSQMLENACSALACIFLGKIRRDDQLLQYGLRIHNNAIQRLVHTMSHNPCNSHMEDIVYTCVIFQQIQVHQSSYSIGEWISHIDGLSAIMRHHCPTTPMTPLLAAIFGEHQKLRVALAGFMFLSKDTITWLKEPNNGGTLFKYIELLAEISDITAAVSRTNPSDYKAGKSLLRDCLTLKKKHLEFWMQINPNSVDGEEIPTYARGELKTSMPPIDDLFGPAYRFSSLNDAILHTLLWLSLSFVYPLLRQCRDLAMASDVPHSFPVGHAREESERLSIFYVTRAIRCLPYCAQEGMNPWAMYYGLLVACSASRVYTHAQDWGRFLWAQDLFIYLERSGFGFAAPFRVIWWNYWFEKQKHDPVRVLNLRKPDKEHRLPIQGPYVEWGNPCETGRVD